MSYDPLVDTIDDHAVTANSQPRAKTAITPSLADIVHPEFGYPKAIVVHVAGGGRASLEYLPLRNADADTVEIEVADGWVSDTMVRRVIALDAIDDGEVATVWGLYS